MVQINQLWFAKYKPKRLLDVIGQSAGLGKLANFCGNFPGKKKALLIYGPPGTGKTSAVYALAEEQDYEIVELNSSDFRNTAKIEEVLGSASKQMSLFSSKKIILIDELDGISGVSDRGGVPSIVKVIKGTNFPVVLVANDPWISKFKTLRLYSELVEFPTLKTKDVSDILRKICRQENIIFEDVAINKLAATSNGDIRAAINDLQAVASSKKLELVDVKASGRDLEEQIFNALRLIFKSFDSSTAVSAVDDLAMENSMITHWLNQNITSEYKLPIEIRDAYRALGDADIFENRIRRQQHWGFMRYVKFFLSAGVQQAKLQARSGFQSYTKPDLRNIFIMAAKRSKAKGIASNLSSQFHASSSTIQKSFLPYLKYMSEVNPTWGKEIESLLET